MAKKKEVKAKTTKSKPAKKGKTPVKKIATKKTAVKKVAKKTASKKAIVKKVANPKNNTAKGKVVKNETQILAETAIEGILELKGKKISLLNLTKIENRVCDYFIICQADSNTQVNAIADSVTETVKKKLNERPYRSEGFENSEWILIDYVTVVVHIFQTQIREFYNLESLWADAEIKHIAFD